jgi:hypothetical protein
LTGRSGFCAAFVDCVKSRGIAADRLKFAMPREPELLAIDPRNGHDAGERKEPRVEAQAADGRNDSPTRP